MTAATELGGPCTGPCPYDAQHQLGADLCAYQPNGIVKPGCADEIVFEGPAQALRKTGFGPVGSVEVTPDGVRSFWQRARTTVRLVVVPNRGGWKATVRTSANRTYEITSLTELVERIAR